MMTDLWHRSWPWYVTGPLVGLIAVSLLAIGSKQLGVSSNLRHLCAMLAPGKVSYFGYDWRREGLWNLVFILGVVVGGFVGGVLLANPHPVAITPAAVTSLAKLGIRDFSGLVPHGWQAVPLEGMDFNEGFVASPHPDTWLEKRPRTAGLTATWATLRASAGVPAR